MKRVFIILGVLLILGLSVFLFFYLKPKKEEVFVQSYLASSEYQVEIYDEEYIFSKDMIRGQAVLRSEKVYNNEEIDYYKIIIDDTKYFVKVENIVDNINDVVKEDVMYLRTYTTLYKSYDSIDILLSIKKGEKLDITGYYDLKEDGSVSMYKVKYNDQEGYIYSKYIVKTHEEALANYDSENSYKIHEARGDKYGGGDGASLDYYPVEKPVFKDNVMPDEARTLYLNSAAIKNVDSYISFAKDNNINAFVVDMKDGALAYQSLVAKEYSPTSYSYAADTFESYQANVKKLIDNGFYVIGRIVVFKDDIYSKDHPENTIMDTRTNKSFRHNGSAWPSPYKREVWEYNVALAIEGVKSMGFHEIQFDYVRFPDRTYSYEKSGYMNMQNEYSETKAQAIQQFAMYAADCIHKNNAYISIDVFGEAAHNYVTAYGQYWPAISNVVDVISPMPYPDHFNKYDYGIKEVVWTVPYKLLKAWGTNYAAIRQTEIPTPAKVRSWIQAYNAIREPYITYDATKAADQIRGLYESGLNAGYITWSSSSSLSKYKSYASTFSTNFLN